MDKTKELHETCSYLMADLEKCNAQIRQAGGELSAGQAEYLDTLLHAIKCAKTSIAMMEADGYSREGHSYGEGSSYRGYSERRGQPRDSMGRYSRDEGQHEGMSHDYLDAGLSEVVNIARGKMVGLPPEEKRRRVQMITDELSK